MFKVGTDLVHIPRIAKLYQQFGDRFVQRILSQTELDKFCALSSHSAIPFLAKRFAAKEAVSKALGTGIGEQLSFQDISILNDAQGAPIVILSQQAQLHFQQQISLSISDENDYALAFSIAYASK